MAKAEKTRNSGTMTESEFRSHIISALRQASRWWKPKQKAIAKARVSKGVYRCEQCGNLVPATLPPLPGKKRRRKGIAADHINSVVGEEGFVSYDLWIERCFVEEGGWQALCYDCHSAKTRVENQERRTFKKEKKT